MKGVIFTLDAIFALIIAIASIAILLYFQYHTQAPYSIIYSNTQAIITSLLSTSVESVQNSSLLAEAMANQFAGANETWPQFMNGALRNGSNDFGPLEPIISYTYNSGNTITTSVVADYGNIYFAANNIMYAVNATTNRLVWARYVASIISSTPALYSGSLIFANSLTLTSLDARTGSLIWTNRAGTPITSPITVYDNKVIFGASDNKVYAFYANNGTGAWSYSVGSNPTSISVISGSLAVKTSATSTINIILLVQTGTSVAQLWGSVYSPLPTNNLAGQGQGIYFGSGLYANAIFLNGTKRSSLFPVGVGSGVSGVAIYKNYAVYQTATSVNALSPSGSQYWDVRVPPSFGTTITNATPTISGRMVYTLWSNGLAAQDLNNGTIEWFALIPKTKPLPYMTLAYGRIYVVVGSTVITYGACDAPLHASLLSAIATMELNSRFGCATALSNSAYPAMNYTLFVGNAVTPYVQTASFDGSTNYIAAKNSGPLNSSLVGVSFWVKINSYSPSGVRLVNYGDNGGCMSPTTSCGWFFSLTSSNTIQFSVMANGNPTSVNSIALNKNAWYFISGTYNGTAATLYINGNTPTPYTANMVGTITSPTPNINLTMGTGIPAPGATYFSGNIANLQIYNRPLKAQQVSQLYLRGIQGVPLQKSGIVAWYPLNGDSNDYALFNPGYNIGANFIVQNYIPPNLANAYGITRSSVLLPLLNYTTGAYNTLTVGVYSWR